MSLRHLCFADVDDYDIDDFLEQKYKSPVLIDDYRKYLLMRGLQVTMIDFYVDAVNYRRIYTIWRRDRKRSKKNKLKVYTGASDSQGSTLKMDSIPRLRDYANLSNDNILIDIDSRLASHRGGEQVKSMDNVNAFAGFNIHKSNKVAPPMSPLTMTSKSSTLRSNPTLTRASPTSDSPFMQHSALPPQIRNLKNSPDGYNGSKHSLSGSMDTVVFDNDSEHDNIVSPSNDAEREKFDRDEVSSKQVSNESIRMFQKFLIRSSPHFLTILTEDTHGKLIDHYVNAMYSGMSSQGLMFAPDPKKAFFKFMLAVKKFMYRNPKYYADFLDYSVSNVVPSASRYSSVKYHSKTNIFNLIMTGFYLLIVVVFVTTKAYSPETMKFPTALLVFIPVFLCVLCLGLFVKSMSLIYWLRKKRECVRVHIRTGAGSRAYTNTDQSGPAVNFVPEQVKRVSIEVETVDEPRILQRQNKLMFSILTVAALFSLMFSTLFCVL